MMFNTVFCVAGAVLLSIAGCLGQADVCGRAPLNTKILGGLNAGQGSWPWQASLHVKSYGAYFCGGSLISERWVLTAAACFDEVDESDIEVYLGRLTQTSPNPYEQLRTGLQVIKYPDDYPFYSSLALVQLSSSVTFSDYIKPVCLAAAGSVFVEGTESWVTGWGFDGDTFPDVLQEVEVPIANNIACSADYKNLNIDNMICAGFVNGGRKGPCSRDVGDPLVIRQGSQWIQSGVTIAFYCFDSNLTVYAKVSEYEEWIRNYTSSSLPGFVSYPVISTFTDGGSVNLSSFPLALAFSIIPLFISRFF